MHLAKKIWARRPFFLTKLAQLTRLVYESHRHPIQGSPGLPLPGDSVMFLGHSSFLIKTGGLNLLIDPVFATRLILLRRQRRPGIRLADLPRIHAILLTHAHMDHLDLPTLRRLRRHSPTAILVVPTGVEDLVRSLGFAETRTLAWWQSTRIASTDITLTPARHWGARLFQDTHRLFGGFVLASPTHRIFHAGDTAYHPGFPEIATRLGPLDLALLPIGAYFPDSYRAVHTSPEEALRAFLDLRATHMVPMHFGTFRLGREPMEEPPIRLLAEAARLGITPRIHLLAEGQSLPLT